MPLTVTNTLTGDKEAFEPRNPPEVRMYVCGLTVYDYVHIGHARTYVAYDVIRRWMETRGYDVLHVQNITDVDDKIIKRAGEVGEDPIKLAERFTEEADRDLDRLNILRAHHYPKVSDHIPEIIAMTQRLIERGHAYVGEDEHGQSVYFDVKSDPDYGKLSHLDLEQMREGVRKTVAGGKRDPADFALWKAAKPGEVSWESPWGDGRPGWHIECSAMSTKLLGDSFDIHGGGKDLVFPHHENEVAQSESATGVDPFVKYWIHTGFLTVEGEKMSKSLGNFVTLRDALQEWRPEALRLWLASTHYKSPIDYSRAGLEQATRNVERIENMLANVEHALANAHGGTPGDRDAAFLDTLAERRRTFEEAMDSDFNTPVAVRVLFDLVTDLNKYVNESPHVDALKEGVQTFQGLADVLGLITPEGGAEAAQDATAEQDLLDLLLEVRQEARRTKQFGIADQIRDRLTDLGYVIEDTAEGPRVRRK